MSAEDDMVDGKRWLRVAMHAHSEWSYDAKWPLARIAWVMPWFGADVVMMCEHDTGFPAERFDEYRAACAAASTAQCTIIPGIEYSDETNDVHLPTWGVDRFLGAARPVIETLSAASEAGGASVFAHPARHEAWERYEDTWTAHLAGIELWNRKTDGIAPGVEAIRLLKETGLSPVVAMDFHRRNQLWPLINLVEVGDGPLEEEIVAAMKAGRVTPLVFGEPVLDEEGDVTPQTYRRSESARLFVKRHVLRRH